MELALEMTDEGEISLKSSLESCNRNSLTYVIAFDIKFTPTTPHSRMITSHLLFDPNIIQRQELIADLKKREKSNLSVLTKFTGIPHLQIGLVRDVIYKLISFMKGTYKVNTRGETVTFHFTIPLGQGAYNVAAQTNEDFNFSISQLRFDENGVIKYSKTKSSNKTPQIGSFQIPTSSLNTELMSHQKVKAPKCLKTGNGRTHFDALNQNQDSRIQSFSKINESSERDEDSVSNAAKTPVPGKRNGSKLSAKFGSSPQELTKANQLNQGNPKTPRINFDNSQK